MTTMPPSHDPLYDLKKRHLENGFPNGHLDPRLDKSPLLANGYHAPPHFNPLQYMAHHMAGLGYPPLIPGGLAGGLPGGPPGAPPPHPISPTDQQSPLKHPPITPETLARLHEERAERERQMALDARRGGLTVGHTPQTTPSHNLPPHEDHSHNPASPALNLSKAASSNDDHDRDEHNDLGSSHDDSGPRDRDDLNDDDDDHPSHHHRRRDSRDEHVSDMDDDDLDKDELAMDTGDAWTRISSAPGQTQLTSPPGPPGATGGVGGIAPLSSTEVLLRNILGLLRVAEENARHHERQTQYEKAELKMEVLRERELRETLEKQLQEEQRNRILMQKRCAKLKKLRRRLQERLEVEVKKRSRYEDHLRSASPDVLNDINDSLTKEMEAIAKELQNDQLHRVVQQQQQQQLQEEDRTKDRLLASPSLATHPAIAAAAAANNSSQWR